MPDPQIGQGFNQDIAYRYKPGQPQAEFYSQKTGQVFGDAPSLASYVNTNYQGANATPENVFGVLAGGFTPRAQALDQVKSDLNSYQQELYGQPELTDANKRQSSSITDSISGEQTNYDTYLKDYNDLRARLEALQSPNYQQAYNDLRTQQGVPGYEQDYLKSQQDIRKLPYVNRTNNGNAGVMTEGQLTADTQQKDIPLEIQQANILDRLKLANDFINNSMNFKQSDYNASRQSLTDAINTASQAINLSHTHLNDLLTMKQQEQARQDLAAQFAYENRISTPFYDIGGTVYRTSDRMPAHNQAEYVAMGGKGDFSDVQKVDANAVQERDTIAQLIQQYPDAGITLNDNLQSASQKLQNSQLYAVKKTGKYLTYTGSDFQQHILDTTTGQDITPGLGNGGGTGGSGGAIGDGSVQSLLNYYVHGDASVPAQYSPTVFSILQQQGINVDASTPASQLMQYLPQFAQAVAKAEGYGQANNAGTAINNPGNLLFNNQPGATPFTAKNGYTYAKFATPQAGYQALQNDLAAKIQRFSGASGSGQGDLASGPTADGLNPSAIANLSPAIQAQIKAIAEYRQAPPSIRSAQGFKIMSMVNSYDPTYDANQYGVRSKLRQSATSGPIASTVTAANTAIQHLKLAKDDFSKLGNGSIPFINSLTNKAKTASGSAAVTGLNQALDAVSSELSKIYAGAGATTEGEINNWRAKFSANMSPAQFNAAIQEGIQLMAGKLDAIQNQYEQGMGKPRDFQIIDANSRKILNDEFGVNLDKLGVVQGQQSSSQSNTMNYNGHTYIKVNGGWQLQQ